MPKIGSYNFTEHGMQVLFFANEAAHHLHHEYVGTEHLLLGFLRVGEGVGITALRNVGADPDQVRISVEETVRLGRATGLNIPDVLPWTSRVKKVLEMAITESKEWEHEYVGCEHLLLGFVREEKGIAAQILVDSLGPDLLRRLRQEVGRLNGHPVPSAHAR